MCPPDTLFYDINESNSVGRSPVEGREIDLFIREQELAH